MGLGASEPNRLWQMIVGGGTGLSFLYEAKAKGVYCRQWWQVALLKCRLKVEA